MRIEPPLRTLTLTYTESLIRRAVLAFFRRTVGAGSLVAMAAVAAALAFLVWQGERSWVVGAFGALFLALCALAVAFYFVHVRIALRKLRAMGSPTATWELGDATLSMSSEVGSASMRWSAVTELWRFDTFWLLLISRAHFVTLPLECAPEDARAFLLGRVTAAGGKIVG